VTRGNDFSNLFVEHVNVHHLIWVPCACCHFLAPPMLTNLYIFIKILKDANHPKDMVRYTQNYEKMISCHKIIGLYDIICWMV
jgi:hypothetical protein